MPITPDNQPEDYEPIEGDIWKPAYANRAIIQTIASQHTKTKEETLGWLYELVAAGYVRRDTSLTMQALRLISEIQGWIATPSGGG